MKIRCIYLFTRSSNSIAISLYKKHGFNKENKIGKIYLETEPEELVMTKFF